MKIKISPSVLVIAVLSAALALRAQEPTATLVGRVVDPFNAVVVGVAIEVRNTDTNQMRTATTDKQGEYTVSALDPGNYEVSITAPGFENVHEPLVVLAAGQTARLDAHLVVGSAHEVVNVTTEVGVLNSETSDKGDTVAPVEISETPLNGRDFNDLVFNIAGIAPSEENSKGSEFVANGARSDTTNVLVDGMNNTNPRDATAEATPPLDALQEFKVQTSNYSAQYGRVAGPVINLTLKKGGNQLKGSVVEFLRNDIFDARNHFDPPGMNEELRRNQFGATVGGPVIIPHLYNGHDKTFFLFSWESYRDVNATNDLTTVPTDLERSGDFSQSFDPMTGTTLTPGELKDVLGNAGCVTTAPNGDSNYIPVASTTNGQPCRDAVAATLMNFIPQPTPYLAGQANNFIQIARNWDTWDNYLLKIDRQIGSKDEASFRGERRTEDTLNPYAASPLGYWGDISYDEQAILGVTETHIFSPNLINEFRSGLTRDTTNEYSLDAGTDWDNPLGIALPRGDMPTGKGAEFPDLKITSYSTLGDSEDDPVEFTTNNYDSNDTLTWDKGRHTIKFGGDILKVQYFQPTNSELSGALGFDGKTSGNGFADFMRGAADSVDLRTSTTVNHLFDTSYSVFVQDDYKVLAGLTLNLGLRYEYESLPYEENGQLSNFIPSLNKLLLAGNSTIPAATYQADLTLDPDLALASQYGYPRTLIYPNHLRFAPRVGFAWRPFMNSQFVVRGGYGIFYTGSRLSAIRTELAGEFPFSTEYDYESKGATTIETAFQNQSPTVSGVSEVNGYQPNAGSSYLQSYNLTVEKELPKGIAIEIAYTGSKGTHLGRQYDINQEVRSVTYPDGVRPYTFFGLIDNFNFNAYSNYNAGTVTALKRFEHGLMFRINYTYAKSLDLASGLNFAGAGGYEGAQNSLDPDAEYGRSDFDRRHVLNGNWVYQLPFRNKAYLRGWGLAGSAQAETGTPLTPQYTVPVQDDGEPTRPDRICNGALPKSERSQYHWFNTACFVQLSDTNYLTSPTGYMLFGNSGRNILDIANRITIAGALTKLFPVREHGNIQLRWEVYDVTNHTNFNTPIDTLDTQNANTITSSQDPREMQFGAKYIF